MTKKKWKIYGVIAAFVVLASFAVPSFADEVSDLQARLDAAEARIAELQPVNDIDIQRSREMRSLVQEVLADAESRASFQGTKSPVTINVHGFVQSRYSYNSGGDVEANHGFEIPGSSCLHRQGL